METIAASGLVGGRREAAVGSQVQGVVSELFVREGDVVSAGQPLARIRDDVAAAQVKQAEQALATARSLQLQAEQRPQMSEIDAARARVRQGQNATAAAATQIERGAAAVLQAGATIDESRAQVTRAGAAVRQADARRELAAKTAERYRSLLAEGAISRQTADQAEAEERSAEAESESARENVNAAVARVAAGQAARDAAERDVDTARIRLKESQAAADAAGAELRTVEGLPRAEGVDVARRRAKEAESALVVARRQRDISLVTAPFAGTVTEVIAERGAPVGMAGVVRLVQTGETEIRMDVDENNLPVLRAGQRAIITSSAFHGITENGRVSRVGARVDSARGTVEVTVVPSKPVSWLRPGQTVNINVVTVERARRLMIPATAIRRDKDRNVVLVVVDGVLTARGVTLGPASGSSIPVLDGITSEDRVVVDVGSLQPGAHVRVKASKAR